MSVIEWIAVVRASLELAKEFRDFIKPNRNRIKTEREKLLEEFHERQLRNVRAVLKMRGKLVNDWTTDER